MMIATGEQRLARRRAKRRCVKSIELQTARRQALGIRGLAGTAEGARRPKARIIEQDNQDVGSALGRTQLLDGREFGVRILRVECHQAGSWPRGYRKNATVNLVNVIAHKSSPFEFQFQLRLQLCVCTNASSFPD